MFRGRWATGTKYKYYFNKSGVALANSWLSYQGKRYYFLANSRMATGWQKIGKYRYYFDKKTGALAKKYVGGTILCEQNPDAEPEKQGRM